MDKMKIIHRGAVPPLTHEYVGECGFCGSIVQYESSELMHGFGILLSNKRCPQCDNQHILVTKIGGQL